MSDWFEERPINKANRQRVADTIHSRLSFVGVEWVKTPDDMQTRKEVRMLDYACGPGFLSKVRQLHRRLKMLFADMNPGDLRPLRLVHQSRRCLTLDDREIQIQCY
jgi:hypothetical protein